MSVVSSREGNELVVRVKYSSGLVRSRTFHDEVEHDAYCATLLKRLTRDL